MTDLQAIIDAAPEGTIVELPPGQYDQPLTITKNNVLTVAHGGILILDTKAKDVRCLDIQAPCVWDGDFVFSGYARTDVGGAAKIRIGLDDFVAFMRCKFSSCVAQEGGAIDMKTGIVRIVDCELFGNMALGEGGGDIHCNGMAGFSSVEMRRCRSDMSVAMAANAKGGSVYGRHHADVTAWNCEFVRSNANMGGALYTEYGGSGLMAQSCTFYQCRAHRQGACMMSVGDYTGAGDNLRAFNCVFQDWSVSNPSTDMPHIGMYCDQPITTALLALREIYTNQIYPGPLKPASNGAEWNHEDVKFTDPATWPPSLSLRYDSPLRNNGNIALYSGGPLDRGHQTRIQGTSIDMGAFEYQWEQGAAKGPGDFDGDGVVGPDEYDWISANWGREVDYDWYPHKIIDTEASIPVQRNWGATY